MAETASAQLARRPFRSFPFPERRICFGFRASGYVPRPSCFPPGRAVLRFSVLAPPGDAFAGRTRGAAFGISSLMGTGTKVLGVSGSMRERSHSGRALGPGAGGVPGTGGGDAVARAAHARVARVPARPAL